jgi:DnaK suppressor protein
MALQQHAAIESQSLNRAHPPQLTGEQILCMGEEHYMGEAQKKCFRALLIAMEELLEARARESAAEIAIGGAGADPIDRASAEEEHQLAIAARARDAVQLVQVRAALKRIDADEFGWCVETGDMIGIGRLLICPTTTLCVEAQQRSESKTTRYRS